ncbi:response regulator [Myxococcota bacterium]|nr:response regulator [Myxococcota bacterium]
MRIMIIEDDPDVGTMLQIALSKAGHQASIFGHAGLAIGAIVRGNFELLITDLMLPNVSGVDAIKMIHGEYPYLPIIVISGMPRDEWEKKSLEAGASVFMQKPVSVRGLLDEVKMVQDSRVDLTVALIDSQDEHRALLQKGLMGLGCKVHEWKSIAAMMDSDVDLDEVSVILVDASHGRVRDTIAWARGRDELPIVVFDDYGPQFDQDQLMRWGAAFCLTKPVDAVAFVTQTRFFVSPF